MAFLFAARRLTSLAVALVALSLVAGVRAEDAPELPQPSQQQPQATPTQTPAGQTPAGQTPAGQTPGGQKGGAGRGNAGSAASTPPAAEQHRLPPDSTTKQTVALPGRTLSFTATAGSIRLFDDKGEPQADIAYTSYQLDGTDRGTRPVTFLFNGGPGASSAWLQFGDAGPWRLAIGGDGAVASASPDLLPNAETWLDFTDLVFIDPVGTGYSRFVASGDDVHKRFFSVDGDVSSIALVIRRWLEKYDRLLSPKFVDRRKLWRHSRSEDRSQSAGRAGRRRERAYPGVAGVRFPRLSGLQPPAICREPSDHGRGGARSEGAGDARRSCRGRTLCAQ